MRICCAPTSRSWRTAATHRTGIPTIDTSVRGITDCVVTVSVMPIAQHSGTYGGPLPDAITALARIIASLHDDDGNVAIAGLGGLAWDGRRCPSTSFARESGVFDEVRMIRFGHSWHRLLSKPPSRSWASTRPRSTGSSNQIVPIASARILAAPGSLRRRPEAGRDAWRRTSLPPLRGVSGVEVEAVEAGRGYLVDTDAPAYAAAKEALREAFGHTR